MLKKGRQKFSTISAAKEVNLSIIYVAAIIVLVTTDKQIPDESTTTTLPVNDPISSSLE